MSTLCLLESIKSKLTIKSIFSFLENRQKLKLLNYSKNLQNILNLSLYNYQEIYIKNKNINLYVYLDNPKDISKKNLENILTKYHIDAIAIQKFCVNYFRDVSNKIKDSFYNNNKTFINIYSPFLDCLLKTDYFSTIFYIRFDIEDIVKNKLENEYNSFFIKLNDYNSNQLSFNIIFNREYKKKQTILKITVYTRIYFLRKT